MTDRDRPSPGDMLDDVRAVPGAVWRSYLAPGPRVWYMALNKNACTSLKWMTADIAGEDLDTFRAGWNPFIDDTEAVHDRTLWKVSPKLGHLSSEERSAIHPENGWFIFAVVRDPRLRLYSAWQNRLLIENPNSQRWVKEPWYPRHPLTRESVVEDFACFVDFLEKEPNSWLRTKDAHFQGQTEMLVEHAVPYSRIYDISEMGQLKDDLARHLRDRGESDRLYLPRSNPTPLHAIGALFANGVDEQIQRVYAADFDRFGHLWTDFSRIDSAEPWTEAQLFGCEQQAVLGRRIAELHRMARDKRAMAAEERMRADRAERRVRKLRRRVKRLKVELDQQSDAAGPGLFPKVKSGMERIIRR